jgi:hypothetical protein
MIQTNANAINDYANQVQKQLTELPIDQLYEDCKKKIDEWKDQRHLEIDARHAEMLQQLTKLHNEFTEEVKEFQTKKIGSFKREIVEPLTHMLTKQKQVHPKRLKTIETQLQSLEQKIEDIKNPDVIHMNCDELKLNGEVNFIRKHPCDEIEAASKNYQSLELDVIKQKATHHFPLKKSYIAFATSAHFILAYENPSVLLLFDTKTQLRSIDTEANSVCDICWSDTMNLFLIAGKKLQTYDVTSNNLANILLHDPQTNYNIWSITCYFRDILLLDDNGIIERYIWPSFTRKKRWSSSKYLEEDNDSKASRIRLNNTGILAMSIKQKDFQWRIDLFDTQLQRIHRGVPLTSNGTADSNFFLFISLTNHEWLVMDYWSKPKRLLLLDKNGTLKEEVEKEGFNLALMGKEFLVLRDGTGLSLYKLSQEA